MKTRRNALIVALSAIGLKKLIAQAQQKYYITGFFHNAKFNDCTVPPIVTTGKDRIDTLLHCCSEGGLTVWTEEEWKEFRKKIGDTFDKSCAEQKVKAK